MLSFLMLDSIIAFFFVKNLKNSKIREHHFVRLVKVREYCFSFAFALINVAMRGIQTSAGSLL